jgi:hypothetical protein
MSRLPYERVYIVMNPAPRSESHSEMVEREGEGIMRDTDTLTRHELTATETGRLIARIFETTRELRGEAVTHLKRLTAISETEATDAA